MQLSRAGTLLSQKGLKVNAAACLVQMEFMGLEY